jgi:phosphopantothenoylcysteine synthetase/decarboxylase
VAGRLVEQARARGWDVHLIATPAALDFLDVPALQSATGHPVRSQYRTTADQASRPLPHANAIVVAPATYNTINKWAAGISDTYALGILAEAGGLNIPTVVLPFVNTALAANPAFGRSVALLRDAGVHVLLGPGQWEPHPPGTGNSRLDAYPWHHALDTAERLISLAGPPPGAP